MGHNPFIDKELKRLQKEKEKKLSFKQQRRKEVCKRYYEKNRERLIRETVERRKKNADYYREYQKYYWHVRQSKKKLANITDDVL